MSPTIELMATVAGLERKLEEAQAELKATRHVLEMDDPRLLKAVQTIERLIRERDEAAAREVRYREALGGYLCVLLANFAIDAAEWGDEHDDGCRAREWAADDDWVNDWVACGICRMAEGIQAAGRVCLALAPAQGKEKE